MTSMIAKIYHYYYYRDFFNENLFTTNEFLVTLIKNFSYNKVNTCLVCSTWIYLDKYFYLFQPFYTCLKCVPHWDFPRKYLFDEHNLLYHSGLINPFKCLVQGCGRTFQFRTALTRHKRGVHKNEGKVSWHCYQEIIYLMIINIVLPFTFRITFLATNAHSFRVYILIEWT